MKYLINCKIIIKYHDFTDWTNNINWNPDLDWQRLSSRRAPTFLSSRGSTPRTPSRQKGAWPAPPSPRQNLSAPEQPQLTTQPPLSLTLPWGRRRSRGCRPRTGWQAGRQSFLCKQLWGFSKFLYPRYIYAINSLTDNWLIHAKWPTIYNSFNISVLVHVIL